MARASSTCCGCGEATTRRKPLSPSALTVQPFSRAFLQGGRVCGQPSCIVAHHSCSVLTALQYVEIGMHAGAVKPALDAYECTDYPLQSHGQVPTCQPPPCCRQGR